ncbi:MAG: universal stress protein [Chloroflexi bacterium]|nr:universal stress protein [Chloroflexota bacterium]
MTSSVQESANYNTAVQDFRRARKQASMQQLIAKVTGKSMALLSFDEVQEKLHLTGEEVDRGVQEIQLEAVVGSVGRYEDFTRDFLPKKDSNIERWSRVKAAILNMRPTPPIDVYQVGEVYFVIDGNHRVSVARQLNAETITARVTEVKTRVPLMVDDDPDEVIAKAQYVEFLEATNFDKLVPDCNLLMTFTGQFDLLRSQIAWHAQKLAEASDEPVDNETAVVSWYKTIYMPVIQLVREQGVMHYFQRRTETDIYVLLSNHRLELEDALGWEVDTTTAVTDLKDRESERGKGIVSRIGHRLLEALVPPELEDGPAPGKWREKQIYERRHRRLFSDYLIAIRGNDADWHMLDQAILMAQSDNDRIMGLHVVPHKSQINSPEVQAICERFEARCEEVGIVGEMAIEVGNVVDKIIERSTWVDLVITKLNFPPDDQPLARLSNGFTQLVQRCPRPIMAFPPFKACLPMERLLLAYDGSLKAKEALFVATYLVTRWLKELVVVTVDTDRTSADALTYAQAYIESYGILNATYVLRQKPIADAILETAVEYDCNTLVMGGFGFRPVKHLVLGSTVERVLKEFRNPVLICR